MDFSTPWSPTLNGNQLSPCALIADLVRNKERPSIRWAEEEPWSVGAIAGELREVGAARDAIHESVLMIWRLWIRTEEGKTDDEWKAHLVA